ncbi:hypothetical protein PoB_006482500 [Plakobranchus ocellatus]|uniref:Uncharacterized protein n=1 Tax=Plakobranchus ocellatus TaxID=259542 RepID=A0AAV4D2J1_9GAST|nr:hypothetical protein PoB_006482500 [Plakobranchus ocellatus]
MLQLASGKVVSVVTKCAALRNPKSTRDLHVLILRDRWARSRRAERHVCEGFVVRKRLVEESQLTVESDQLITNYWIQRCKDEWVPRRLLEEETRPPVLRKSRAFLLQIRGSWKKYQHETSGSAKDIARIRNGVGPRLYYRSVPGNQANEGQGPE